MSFDLRIRFNGLCLLVPEPARDDADPPSSGRFHVLLPDVKHRHPVGGVHAHAVVDVAEEVPDTAFDTPCGAGHAGHFSGEMPEEGEGEPQPGGGMGEIVEHLPRLVFDTAYRTAGSREFTRELACLDVRGQAIPLLGLGPDPIRLFVPGEVANLDEVSGGGRVPRRFVDDPAPGPELATRVTIDRGCVTDYLLGAQATLKESTGEEEEPAPGGKEPRLTAQVEWTIRGIETEDGSLTLRPRGLNGVPDGREIRLFPIGRTIHLELWNVPKSELPGSPARNDKDSSVEHFAGLFDLLDLSGGVVPVVPLLADVQKPPKSGCFSEEERDEGGGPTTPGTLRCMVGTASLEG